MSSFINLATLCSEISNKKSILLVSSDKNLVSELRRSVKRFHHEEKWNDTLDETDSYSLIMGSDEAVKFCCQPNSRRMCFGRHATEELLNKQKPSIQWNGQPVVSFILRCASFFVVTSLHPSPAKALLLQCNGTVVDDVTAALFVVFETPPLMGALQFIKMKSREVKTNLIKYFKGKLFLEVLTNSKHYEDLCLEKHYNAELLEGIRFYVPSESIVMKKDGLSALMISHGAIIESSIHMHMVVLIPTDYSFTLEETRSVFKHKCPVIKEEWVTSSLEKKALTPVTNYLIQPRVHFPLEHPIMSSKYFVTGNGSSPHLKEVMTRLLNHGASLAKDTNQADIIVTEKVLLKGPLDPRMRTLHCIKFHLGFEGAQPCAFWHFPLVFPNNSWVKSSDFVIESSDHHLLQQYLTEVVKELGGNILSKEMKNPMTFCIQDSSFPGTNTLTPEQFIDSIQCMSFGDTHIDNEDELLGDPEPNFDDLNSSEGSESASDHCSLDPLKILQILSTLLHKVSRQFNISDHGYILEKSIGFPSEAYSVEKRVCIRSLEDKVKCGFICSSPDKFNLVTGIYAAEDEEAAKTFRLDFTNLVTSIYYDFGSTEIYAINDAGEIKIVYFTLSEVYPLLLFETKKLAGTNKSVAIYFYLRQYTTSHGNDYSIDFERPKLVCCSCRGTDKLPSLLRSYHKPDLCFTCGQAISSSCFLIQGIPARRNLLRRDLHVESDVKDIILNALNKLHSNFIRKLNASCLTIRLIRRLEEALAEAPFENPDDHSILYFDKDLQQFKVNIFGEYLFVCSNKTCCKAFPCNKMYCSNHGFEDT